MLTPVMRLRTLALLGAGGVALYRMAQQLGVPDGVVPVQPFQLSRYLGRWYEIARIDHVYERGLTDTSADYRLLKRAAIFRAKKMQYWASKSVSWAAKELSL